jgi:hypothetical protein
MSALMIFVVIGAGCRRETHSQVTYDAGGGVKSMTGSGRLTLFGMTLYASDDLESFGGTSWFIGLFITGVPSVAIGALVFFAVRVMMSKRAS